mgnify:CR=1 FL=1
MLKPILTLFLIPLIGIQTLSAQTFEVSGVVKTSNKEIIPYASVFVFTITDSTMVSGSSADENGFFSIKNIVADVYYLKASYVGKTSSLIAVDISTDLNIGSIIIDHDTEVLQEVVVSSKKPTIERKSDRLIFNVENTAVSQGSSWDILKRTPGVIVFQGQVKIKNKPAEVYINDRKVYLSSQELQQLLEGFSGENIKSVEVITSSPAKYDAEGGAILNIVTSKNLSVGYKGSVNGNYAIAKKPKYSLGTSHYYKNNWLNSYLSYTLNSRTDYKRDESQLVFSELDGSLNSTWISDFNKYTKTKSHNLNALLDFTLNDKNSLNFSASALYTPKSDSDRMEITNIYGATNQLDSLFTTSSTLNDNRTNILLSLQHTVQLNESGSELITKANYIYYDNDQVQLVATNYQSPNNTLLNQSSFNAIAKQNTAIYTLQTDYSYSSEKLNFETGIKYSGIGSDSMQDFEDTSTDSSSFEGNVSDDFNYKENIFAGYFSLSREWGKLTFVGGLRGEYTDANGYSIVLNDVNSQDYFSLFPTINIQYAANENSSFGLNYSRRIDRPRFQMLNPFRTYINENNFIQGNPTIQPSITDKINFSYTLKNSLTFDVYYEHIKNEIANLPFQDNTLRYISSITDNLNYSKQYSFDITYQNYINENWYLYLYGSFFYLKNEFVARENGNQILEKDKKSFYLSTQNYITFLKDKSLSTTLTASYFPDFLSGSYTYDKASTSVSLSVQKNFLNNRLIVSTSIEDIFNTSNMPVSSKYLDQNYSYFAKPESRLFSLRVRYKFGNFKLENNTPEEIGEQERLKDND